MPVSTRRFIVLFAILATAAFVAGARIFGMTFIRPDEPLYIGIPLDMSRHHAFLVPLDHGAPDFVKPPLVYWMELGSFSLFGANALAAKLPVWLLGVLTVFLTHEIAMQLFENEATASAAALLLFLNFFFFTYSQAAMMDVPMAFFTAAGVFSFMLAARRDRRWLIPCGASIGLITLVKGPVGILLCLFPIALYAWRFGALKLFAAREALYGAAAFLICAGAWPAALACGGYGKAWFDQFIVGENFGKFAGGRMPFKILLIGLFGGIAPWAFLFIESFCRGLVKMRRSAECFFLVGWIASVFLIFALPARKLPHYVMPAFPACALLIASAADLSGFSIWPTRILLAVIGALWLAGARLTPFHSIQIVIIAGSVALFAAAAALKDRSRLPLAASLFGVLLLTLPVVTPALQQPNQQAAVRALAESGADVAVFAPDDRDPRGFELSPGFATCENAPDARRLLASGGVLIFAAHNRALLAGIPLQVERSWPVWKTGIGLGAVISAVTAGNAASLDEEMSAGILGTSSKRVK